MNKEMTGRLIAEARKEKHMTQQELADQLHITGKAVSKWETGVSAPDVGLLIPLSETLGLTVTELLEGRRTEAQMDRTPEQVEDIVKKAIAFTEEAPEKQRAGKKKRALIYTACALIAALEFGLLWLFDVPLNTATMLGRGLLGEIFGSFGVLELLSVGFGAYLMFFITERLPAYYDDNEISSFSSGAFRMNMPGVTFNNRNWPHILRALRIWAMLSMVLTVPVAAALAALFPAVYASFGRYLLMALYMGGLFVPVYIVARRYE